MSTHVTSSRYDKDPNEVRRNLVREMNRIGAYRLEGQYSGGHDEGGLDELIVLDKYGESLAYEGAGWEHPLHQAVEDLLSMKFYTWALDMSVYGRVYVDLKEKRAWTEGYEEVMTEQDDPDPIEMDL